MMPCGRPFINAWAEFSKLLAIALSTEAFVMQTDEQTLRRYKADLTRFQNLKAAVKMRYAEAIDYRDYEPKIKKLLDTHIQASEVVQLNAPVNIFDDQMFGQVKEEQGGVRCQDHGGQGRCHCPCHQTGHHRKDG